MLSERNRLKLTEEELVIVESLGMDEEEIVELYDLDSRPEPYTVTLDCGFKTVSTGLIKIRSEMLHWAFNNGGSIKLPPMDKEKHLIAADFSQARQALQKETGLQYTVSLEPVDDGLIINIEERYIPTDPLEAMGFKVL